MNNELKIIFLICSIITSVLCFIIVMALLSSGNPQENSAGAIFYCIVMPIVMWIIYSQLPSNKKYENHNNANYKNETMSTNNEGYLDISDKAEIETAEYNNEQAINLLEQAQIYSQKEDYENAIKCATKAIEIDPNLAQAYGLRAIYYHSIRDIDKSINDYKQALEIKPDIDAIITSIMGYTSLVFLMSTALNFPDSTEESSEDCEIYSSEFPHLAFDVFKALSNSDNFTKESLIVICDKLISKFKNKYCFPYIVKALMYLQMTEDNKFSSDLSDKIKENIEYALKINKENLFARTVRLKYYLWYCMNIYIMPAINRNKISIIDIDILNILVEDKNLEEEDVMNGFFGMASECSANEVIKLFGYIYNLVTKPELINVDRAMFFEYAKNDDRISEHIPILSNADKYAEVAIIANPQNPKGYVARSLYKLMSNKRDEALIDIDKALEIDSEEAFSYIIKGVIYQVQGKDEKVVELLKPYLEKYPDTDENLKELLNELLQKSELKASHTEAIENTQSEDLGRELDI